MRSSTSSSRAPNGPWGRTWLLAVALAVAALGGLELLWRDRGHQPTVLDDAALWALHRDDADDVVLLGSSRIRLGFHMQAARAHAPAHRFVQLAVDGKAPVAALADLAADPSFRGIVVCSITAEGLRTAVQADQDAMVAYYRSRWSIDRRLNRMLGTAVQDRLNVVAPERSLVRVLQSLASRRRLPEANYLRTLPDRSRLADYGKLDIDRHRTERVKRAHDRFAAMERLTPAAWLTQARTIEPLVAAIQARGGRVVFVRFPTTGEHLALEEEHFPKAVHWDRFAAATAAATVHFQDVATLQGYVCPDTSHLDARDTPRFTRALCDEMTRRGVLRAQVTFAGVRGASSAIRR